MKPSATIAQPAAPAAPTAASPELSVLIASRERPGDLLACIASILRAEGPSREILAVVQGETPPDFLESPVVQDPRVRLIHQDGMGKSRALNAALAVARAPYLAFTDDDCRVSEGWLSQGLARLQHDPAVGLLFGPLIATGHNPADEFVTTFLPSRDRVLRGARARNVSPGVGANMFATRGLFDAIGEFDEMLGPGAPLPTAEDADIARRALRAGFAIAQFTGGPVVHMGRRAYQDGAAQSLVRAYFYGEGVILAKHARTGDPFALVALAKVALREVGRAVAALPRTGRPTGVARAAHLVSGFGTGMRTPLDHNRATFRVHHPSSRGRRLSVTVAIPTKDRVADLERCLRGVVPQAEALGADVLVIDQSRDEGSARVCAAYGDRVTRVHSRVTGASNARNLALELAQTDLVVFIDDDCAPRVGWLTALVEPFHNPLVGLVFGSVDPAPHSPAAGYIVGWKPGRDRVLSGGLAKLRDGGIGASMAIRRALPERFDPALGPGARFPSCEEGDFAYRTLRGGWSVAHVRDGGVTHYGFRPHEQGASAMRDTSIGIAAAYLKHVRCGDATAAAIGLYEISRSVTTVVLNAARLRRPLGFRRLVGFGHGVHRSLRSPLDRRTRQYLMPLPASEALDTGHQEPSVE